MLCAELEGGDFEDGIEKEKLYKIAGHGINVVFYKRDKSTHDAAKC